MTARGRPLLGGLTPSAFLRRHWQKRPRLVRGALPDLAVHLSRRQLFGLACRDDVESRLVLERGGCHPWQVITGPQDPARLGRLGPTHWTLLVQGADRHVPALAELRERFDFVPRWRLDDVMVSDAARFGSVGPHVDGYDVFLVQAGGRRRWRIARRFDPALREGLDLRVLRRFQPEQEWVLEPGDLLYLPPGVAHHGVALEDGFMLSVGFRAPSQAELVLAFAEEAARAPLAARLYADPDLQPTSEPGAILETAIRRMRTLLGAGLALPTGDEIADRLGRFLTRPAAGGPEPPPRPLTAATVRARLRETAGLLRSEACRIAYVRRGRRILLFVDGLTHRLPAALAFAAPLLGGRRFVTRERLLPHARSRAFVALVRSLVRSGAFRFVSVPPQGRSERSASRKSGG
jgi:50S ribosomal protein L16 3-hydroxylase